MGKLEILAEDEVYIVRIVPSVFFLLVFLVILIKSGGEDQLAESLSHVPLGPFLWREVKSHILTWTSQPASWLLYSVPPRWIWLNALEAVGV